MTLRAGVAVQGSWRVLDGILFVVHKQIRIAGLISDRGGTPILVPLCRILP